MGGDVSGLRWLPRPSARHYATRRGDAWPLTPDSPARVRRRTLRRVPFSAHLRQVRAATNGGRLKVLDFGGGVGTSYVNLISSLVACPAIDYHIIRAGVGLPGRISGVRTGSEDSLSPVRRPPALPNVDIVLVKNALEYVEDYARCPDDALRVSPDMVSLCRAARWRFPDLRVYPAQHAGNGHPLLVHERRRNRRHHEASRLRPVVQGCHERTRAQSEKFSPKRSDSPPADHPSCCSRTARAHGSSSQVSRCSGRDGRCTRARSPDRPGFARNGCPPICVDPPWASRCDTSAVRNTKRGAPQYRVRLKSPRRGPRHQRPA